MTRLAPFAILLLAACQQQAPQPHRFAALGLLSPSATMTITTTDTEGHPLPDGTVMHTRFADNSVGTCTVIGGVCVVALPPGIDSDHGGVKVWRDGESEAQGIVQFWLNLRIKPEGGRQRIASH